MWRKGWKFFLDILFPLFCAGCNREGTWWCDECVAREESYKQSCPVCYVENDRGLTCEQCRAVSALDGVTALFYYRDEGAVARLIHRFKYGSAHAMKERWKEIITDRVSIETQRGSIVAVPLHVVRGRERGYNQAELLAVGWGVAASLPVLRSAVKRVRQTEQQAKLSREERFKNMQDVFAWTGSFPPPEVVYIVDDVFTTGATMGALARTIKAAGAQRVYGLVLARGGS